MKRYALIIVTAFVIGTVSGYAVSGLEPGSNQEGDNFCGEVEKEMQSEMQQGYVNCFDPSGVNFELREDIRNSTSISCICRKKVGEVVQELKIAQPDQ